MIELIHEFLDREKDWRIKRLKLAEFLQHLILQSLYRQDAFKHIVFTGGTAIRLLYHTKRFSEDLDFSLGEAKGFHFEQLLDRVQKDLGGQKIMVDLHIKKQGTVAKANLKFGGLMKEFGISPLKDQKLTIRLDVDQNPPKGGTKGIVLVTDPVSYTVTAYDLPSLFATKLHAVFYRKFTKGRDYYDLVWFLGKNIKPNFSLLNDAIRQTQGEGHEIGADTFKSRLTDHLASVDFKQIRDEVERFVMDRAELKFLDLQPLMSLLRNY